MAIKICIDAGHYGKYNPSPVVAGYFEAQMVWTLHLKLKKHLESYGIQVITTRSNQAIDRDLYGRGAAAAGCNLFLSLHSNACDTESVDRPVVIGTLNGKAQALGRKLMQVIAQVMGTNDTPQYSTRAQSDGRDWYGVLRGSAAVGVGGLILEHSFHTNRRAAQWLMNDANLDKLALAEADCIAAYYGLRPQAEPDEPDAPAQSGQMYRVRKSWTDAASQIGAWNTLEYAKAAADKNPGYAVYDAAGNAVYPQPQTGYLVHVKVNDLRIRKGPGTSYASAGYIAPGKYTIVETMAADGHTWERLKSGAGWIALEYTERL